MMNWEGCGRKRPWSVLRYLPGMGEKTFSFNKKKERNLKIGN
jgi:hypothetical protein